MKKNLFLLVVAFLLGITSMNAATITYSLAEGEKFNPAGWKTTEDMYQGLAADVIAAKEGGMAFGFASEFGLGKRETFGKPNTNGKEGVAYDITAFDLSFWTTEPYASKWGWLGTYLDVTSKAAGQTNTALNNSSYARYCLAAFFGDTIRPGWPTSADYATSGVSSRAYYPTWTYALAIPTTVEVGQEVILDGLYKDDVVFAGWKDANIEGGGYITSLVVSGDITLTAVWDSTPAPGTYNVNYNLQGGVTNDYGWVTGEDMYQGLAADVIAAKEGGMNFSFASWFGAGKTEKFGTPTTTSDAGGIAQDIVTFDLAFWTTEPYASKWGWLGTYLDVTSKAAGQTNTALNSSAYARYSLAAFFGDTIRPGWPVSADYTNAGVSNIAMWQSYWKHAWTNPASFANDTVIALNGAYKEGETFRGWSLYPDGSLMIDSLKAKEYNGRSIYAIFGDYINNMQEVWDAYATLDSTTTKITLATGGIVTYVNGAQFYIQDDFGGMLCDQSGHGFNVGDKVNVKGDLAQYNGFPQISNLTKMEVLTTGQTAAVYNITLAETSLTYDGKCYNQVSFESLKLYKAESQNLFFCDGKDSVDFYNSNINAEDYTVGKRYAVAGILTYYSGSVESLKGTRQLVGDPANITMLPGIDPDPSDYAELKIDDDTKYNITSNWLISKNMGNWNANKPNPVAEQSRGMVVVDGKVYVNWRSSNAPEAGTMKLKVYDATDGSMLDDVYLKDYVFQQPAMDSSRVEVDEFGHYNLKAGYTWNYSEFNQGVIFAPNTGMEVDSAGHILVASLPTDGGVYQIWKIDPATGDGQLVVYMGGTSGVSDLNAWYNTQGTHTIRLDRFAVYGDVTKDAIIIAADQNSSNIYEFYIYDGKWDNKVYEVTCLNSPQGPDSTSVAFSLSPRLAFTEGGAAVYVDGFATYPALFDLDEGIMLQSFDGGYNMEKKLVRPACKTLLLNADSVYADIGSIGILEFKVGDASFFAMGAGNYDGGYTPHSSTKIFRFKDENRNFDEMIPAWEVSKDGFGNNTNAQRVWAQQAVVVNEYTTELYVYVSENGLGKYTITKQGGSTSMDNIESDNTIDASKKVMINGQMYIIRNGVTYTTMGQVAE